MTLKLTENIQMFPITTLDTFPWKPPFSNGFQRKKTSEPPLVPIRRLAPSVKRLPVKRRPSFEKGSVIDVYA
jgi:hypothetical protein